MVLLAVSSRLVSVYSELQSNRLQVPLPLPSVLKNTFDVVDGPPSSAAANPGILYYSTIICAMIFYERAFLYKNKKLEVCYIYIYIYISFGLVFILDQREK